VCIKKGDLGEKGKLWVGEPAGEVGDQHSERESGKRGGDLLNQRKTNLQSAKANF